MTTLKKMTCPDCGAVVEVPAKVLTARCDECGRVFTYSKNEARERIDFLTARISEYLGEVMKMTEERGRLELSLTPVGVPFVSAWKQHDTEGMCHRCGRQTRHSYRGAWSCYEGCRAPSAKRPSTSKYLTMNDLRDVLAQMGITTDDSADAAATEFIKKGPRR